MVPVWVDDAGIDGAAGTEQLGVDVCGVESGRDERRGHVAHEPRAGTVGVGVGGERTLAACAQGRDVQGDAHQLDIAIRQVEQGVDVGDADPGGPSAVLTIAAPAVLTPSVITRR